MYKKGGEKEQWISDKISTLMDEGKSHDQAVAQALSMSQEMFQDGGELPKYQVGVNNFQESPVIGGKSWNPNMIPSTTYNSGAFNFPTSYTAPKTNSWLPGNVGLNDETFKSIPNLQEKTSQTSVVTPSVAPTTTTTKVPTTTTKQDGSSFYKNRFSQTPNIPNEIGFEQGKQYTGLGRNPNYVNQLSTESLNAGEEWGKNNPLPEGVMREDLNSSTPVMDKYSGSQAKTPNFNSNYQDPYQFFNPYGGVDIASGAQFLGQSIENKDPFGIVMGGLKVATGVGRNVFGGMGRENVKNEAMKNYFDNQYEGITGTPQYLSNGVQNGGVFQEGGEQMGGEYPAPQEQAQQVNPEEIMNQVAQAIQQGADPQQIVQQLVSMGIPEQEAMQLVQGLIQQMQSQAPTQEQPVMRNGGDYMSMLKGKRIKDYVLNEKTGNYEVTYED